MNSLKICLAAAGFAFWAGTADAAVVGAATNAAGTVVVGSTENRAALGGQAIRYFVPLGDASGTYGVTNGGAFGTTADSGNGGGTLSMYLRFSGLTIGQTGTLTVRFEDLDVMPVNDPNGFTEQLNVFSNGVSLTGLITAIGATPIGGGSVTGNLTSQALTLFLGTISTTQLLLRLDFVGALQTGTGTNTAEFLRAEISQVPVPAALPLLLSGIAGLGFAGRRRKA